MPATNGYILCRPKGGLNDNLTQIAFCTSIAKQWNRKLIIDTRRSGAFFCQFDEIFRQHNPTSLIRFHASDDLLEELERESVFPSVLQNRILNYSVSYDNKVQNFVDTQTGVRVGIGGNASYAERLLVHEQCGGNMGAISALGTIKLEQAFRQKVIARLAPLLFRDYIALVLRHSDYQTDIERVCHQIKSAVQGKCVYVFTDNPEVIETVSPLLPQSEVCTLPDGFSSGGLSLAALMESASPVLGDMLRVKAISDLIGAAGATQLFISKLKQGGIHGGYSGFSLLAANLHRNRSLIHRLLSD